MKRSSLRAEVDENKWFIFNTIRFHPPRTWSIARLISRENRTATRIPPNTIRKIIWELVEEGKVRLDEHGIIELVEPTK